MMQYAPQYLIQDQVVQLVVQHVRRAVEVPVGVVGEVDEGEIGVGAGPTAVGPAGVPQRVQKRDCGSMAGLPQVRQVTGSGWIFVPHRLQNCASSSDTTVPHP